MRRRSRCIDESTNGTVDGSIEGAESHGLRSLALVTLWALASAVKHLDDRYLDRLLSAILDEQRRRRRDIS